MAQQAVSVKKLMNSIVPISRFNRGEASKIFDEVHEHGMKIVLKNNDPTCVLLNPEKYEEMVEALEDYALYFEAENRLKSAQLKGYITSSDIMKHLGIEAQDLEDVEVDIDG